MLFWTWGSYNLNSCWGGRSREACPPKSRCYVTGKAWWKPPNFRRRWEMWHYLFETKYESRYSPPKDWRLCLGKLFFFYTQIYSSCQLDESMHLSTTCFPRLAISLHCPRLSNHGVAERGAIPVEQKLPRWKPLSQLLSQMTVELPSWNLILAQVCIYMNIYTYKAWIYCIRYTRIEYQTCIVDHWSRSFSQII